MPPPPAELFPYIHWDISPVRPWEWWQIDAEEWTEAQGVQDAIREGQQDAHDTLEAKRDLEREVRAPV